MASPAPLLLSTSYPEPMPFDRRGRRKLMAQMKQRFPQDIDYTVSLDQTLPVTEGMKEILWTLVIADRAGNFCGLSVPARVARHHDSYAGCPGLVVGTFVIFPLVGFSDQYAFDVRVGSRYWTRG